MGSPVGRFIRSLKGHSGGVYSVAMSPDASTLVSSSSDQTVKIWDAATGALIRTLADVEAGPAVAVSPDAAKIITGSSDHTVKIWDTQTGRLIRTLAGHSDYVAAVAVAPDGATMVSASHDATSKVWALAE
jgi:WD40 repeat protein